MRNNIISLAGIWCFIALLSGCAGPVEIARGLAGVSTKVLEDGRSQAAARSFPGAYAACRDKVDNVLIENKVYVYARNEAKKMIAFYMSESDTTPVGVFFREIDSSNTEVAVTSPSRYAKQFIADRIAAEFEKKPKPPAQVKP